MNTTAVLNHATNFLFRVGRAMTPRVYTYRTIRVPASDGSQIAVQVKREMLFPTSNVIGKIMLGDVPVFVSCSPRTDSEPCKIGKHYKTVQSDIYIPGTNANFELSRREGRNICHCSNGVSITGDWRKEPEDEFTITFNLGKKQLLLNFKPYSTVFCF